MHRYTMRQEMILTVLHLLLHEEWKDKYSEWHSTGLYIVSLFIQFTLCYNRDPHSNNIEHYYSCLIVYKGCIYKGTIDLIE